jgi:hypothetical protein
MSALCRPSSGNGSSKHDMMEAHAYTLVCEELNWG